MKPSFANLVALTSLLTLAVASPVHAQLTQLRFDAAKVPVGTALHYQKSNIDGSNATQVSVYVIDGERLESLKWDEGSSQATLVQARMDWRKFSVREFKSYHLERAKPPELRGTLEANSNGTQLKVSFLEGKTVAITHWPWHSYDFDFASLGLVLPHLRNPQDDLIFWRTDVLFIGDRIDFAEIGEVRLHLEATELRHGLQVRRYSIGGPGLQQQYGRLWTDASSGRLIEYQIPIGDEPGFKDVHFRLERTEELTPESWEGFKKAKIGEL